MFGLFSLSPIFLCEAPFAVSDSPHKSLRSSESKAHEG